MEVKEITMKGITVDHKAKILFLKLSKYKPLWIALASDKSVIEEYQSTLAKFNGKKEKYEGNTNQDRKSTREPLTTLFSNDNFDHDEKHSEQKISFPTRKANDFLTAIESINETNRAISTFQIQPSSLCCDIFGCNNNCSEPIVEDDDEVESESSPKGDLTKIDEGGENSNQTSFENEFNYSGSVENAIDNKNGSNNEVMNLSTNRTNTSEELPFSPIFNESGSDHQVYRESINNTSDIVDLSGDREFVNSPTSNSSSGDTVLAFDLSHLLINDINENVNETDNAATPRKQNEEEENDHRFDAKIIHNRIEEVDDVNISLNSSFSKSVHGETYNKGIQNTAYNFESNEVNGHQEEENRGSEMINSESLISKSLENSTSSSSSGEVISFQLDESVWEDIDDVQNEFNINANGQQSVKSSSSEEAEWEEKDSSSSTSEGEPNFSIVILSSDESVSEHEYDTDSINLINSALDKDEDDSSNSENDSESDMILITDRKETAETKPRKIKQSFSANSNTTFSIESDAEMFTPPRRHQPSKQMKMSRSKFQLQREQLTKSIFQHFNTTVFEGSLEKVEVSWSKRLTSTAGLTRLKRITRGTITNYIASIELSAKLIDDEARLQSTLMHEMCHAAAWLMDKISKPPHGPCFKKWANLATRRIPGLLVSTTHEYVTNSYKYAWACTNENCDFIIQRHSRSVDVNRHCCGKCKEKLVEVEVPDPESLKQKQGAFVFTPKQKRKASRFSLFVKEHSNLVRNQLQHRRNGTEKVTQKDVMIECARLWRQKTGEQKM